MPRPPRATRGGSRGAASLPAASGRASLLVILCPSVEHKKVRGRRPNQKPTGICTTPQPTTTVLTSQQRHHHHTIHSLRTLLSPLPPTSRPAHPHRSTSFHHGPARRFTRSSFLHDGSPPPTKARMVAYSLRRATNATPEIPSRQVRAPAHADLSEVFMLRSATLAAAVLPAGHGDYGAARGRTGRNGAAGKLRRLFGLVQRPSLRVCETGGHWTTMDL